MQANMSQPTKEKNPLDATLPPRSYATVAAGIIQKNHFQSKEIDTIDSANIKFQLTSLMNDLTPAKLTANMGTLTKVIKMAINVRFNSSIEIFPPLIDLVLFSSVHNMAEEFPILIRTFSCLVWKCLVDPLALAQLCATSMLDIFQGHVTKLRNVMTFISASSDFKIESMYFDPQMMYMSESETGLFFSFVVKTALELKEITEPSPKKLVLENPVPFPSISALHLKEFAEVVQLPSNHLAAIFKLADSAQKKELVALLLVHDKALLLDKKIHSFVQGSLIPKHPDLYISNQGLFKHSRIDHIISRYTQNNLDNCFRFVLELLDQGANLNYMELKSITDSLVLSLFAISKKPLLSLYTNFNSVKSKTSLISMHLYLNYLVSVNLLSFHSFSNLPVCIVRNFDFFKLPPLPKLKWLLENRLEHREDFEVLDYDNHENLFIALHLGLKQVLLIMQLEFQLFENTNQYTTENINQKLITNLINLVLSSIFSTLTLIQLRDEESVRVKVIKLDCYRVLHRLLNLELKFEKCLVWVCLVNFANDVCYSQVQYLPIFVQAFEFLIAEDELVLNDPLVSSGLNFFFSTFNTKQLEHEVLLVDLSLNEFKHLYQSHGLEQTATPVRLSYVSNSARQQSIHVDQYGK